MHSKDYYIRIEKVLIIVAANPLYQPTIPSSFRIRSNIDSMDNWAFLLPFFESDVAACILVLAL